MKNMTSSLIKYAQTAIILIAILSSAGFAQTAVVKVEGAWARTSVPGQKGTGAFMQLTASQTLKLVSASSPAAGVTEIHEMKMQGDVMKMRAIAALDLPAGKAVQLSPGGYHVMLLDLKAPLAKDTVVPITLVFKDAAGKELRQEVKLPVSARAPAGAMGSDTSAGMHKH